jgi:UDP-N-acetylmuramyl pentapeptide phosphotransferase/UDP-N-acetylglucosamine-1-phosphate transferase
MSDDIVDLRAYYKLVGQIIAAFIVVDFGQVRIESFYGFLGVEVLPEYFSFILSMIVLLAASNAFNLIDGIDGLAGMVSSIAFLFLGLWFGIMGAGIDQNWLADGGNGKIIKFIMIFIISMIIGWAFAFSSYFNILSMFLNMAIVPTKMVLFFLAPITILALSITQIALADKSHKVLGKVADG